MANETEPIEKITDKTVIGCMPVNGAQRIKIYPLDLNPSIRTMLLTSAEKDAKIKELEDKLKVAMRLLDKSQPATSGDSARDQRDAGDWWLALKKLKAE